MKKSKKYPACWLKLYFYYIILLVGFILAFIFLMFKPYYKATINGEFIGYYKNYEEFEEYYNQLPKEIYDNNGIKINRYYTEKPILEKLLVKAKYVKSFNNYILIENQFEKEYIIYCIKVNDEVKFYTKTNEEANKLVEEIKKEVKESTKIIIEEIKTQDKSLISDEESIAQTKRDIIKINSKVTSRGGGVRVNNPDSKYIWPTTSKTITSYYGSRWGKIHTGIDIGVSLNSNIFAVDSGEVIFAGWNGSYGYQVKVQHTNGIVTTYAHCNKVLAQKGQKVEQGDIIAKSGSTGNSTGPHLHFEYLINGSFKNPLNYL